MASLELYGRHAIRRRMSADGVVKHLNVAKDIAIRFLPSGIDMLADALTLEQLEEAFCHSVVMAIATPAHAGL